MTSALGVVNPHVCVWALQMITFPCESPLQSPKHPGGLQTIVHARQTVGQAAFRIMIVREATIRTPHTNTRHDQTATVALDRLQYISMLEAALIKQRPWHRQKKDPTTSKTHQTTRGNQNRTCRGLRHHCSFQFRYKGPSYRRRTKDKRKELWPHKTNTKTK